MPHVVSPLNLLCRPVAGRLLCITAALWLGACASPPGGAGGASASGGAASAPRIGPGMNAQGEVLDPRAVEPGHGQKVKGLGGWEGEITGRPVPGSKFAQLQIGMTASEAQGLLGAPSDFGARPTAKNFIPFFYGADKARYETVYKGQGRLVFSSSGGVGNEKMHLVWIIHSAREDGQR